MAVLSKSVVPRQRKHVRHCVSYKIAELALKSTTSPIFELKMLQTKCREKNQRNPYGFHRPRQSVRSSTEESNMIEPTKENSSKSLQYNRTQNYV